MPAIPASHCAKTQALSTRVQFRTRHLKRQRFLGWTALFLIRLLEVHFEFPGYLGSKFANFCKVPMLTIKVMLFIMLVQQIPIERRIDSPGGRPLDQKICRTISNVRTLDTELERMKRSTRSLRKRN